MMGSNERERERERERDLKSCVVVVKQQTAFRELRAVVRQNPSEAPRAGLVTPHVRPYNNGTAQQEEV